MNTHRYNALAIAICCSLGASAIAQSMSKADFKLGKDRISTEYKTAKTACESMSGNAKDICVVEAKGKEKVARAELEVSYAPSVKNRYEVRIANAESTYALAKEKCDDLAGNPKDVCVKEAKAAQVIAKADAKVQMKTTDANAKANEKSSEARTEAATENMSTAKDASRDKMDAEYKVAKEKCDAMSGAANDTCIAQAKTRYKK
jgi:hypothetical protein